ncbi:MAG: mannose-1-phosphate guanylyltransferase [Nitrospinae bacterium]|nr:mannose-1-phosphate guanylyltransferase [Nitrospinota bacterium]
MIHVVIMAGGKGTRFWPLSREKHPKQLLAVAGERTLIQQTVDRVGATASHENIYIITGASHADEIRLQLPELPPENIVVEPVGRNTAPCVALAAAIIRRKDPRGIMAVFPSDHVITNPAALDSAVKALVGALEFSPELIGIVGIKPSYPETGYGYIKIGAHITSQVYKADGFLEKPDNATAQMYVESGQYLWNAGMFFLRVDTALNEIEKRLPSLRPAVEGLADLFRTPGFGDKIKEVYPTLENISIDYAVMEKAGAEGKVICAVADPGWNDVGSWRSLYDLMPADAQGNRARGKLVAVDSTGALVHNSKRLVALVGVDDVVVIETDDAILVCHKDRAQDVRQVTEKLKKEGLERYL